eukprot:g3068.t1
MLLSENKNVMILNNSFATASKKKKKKNKDASSGGASLGRAMSQEDIQMHLELVDPQKRVEVAPMTPEQKEILKEYTRGMQRRHNRENALLSRKRVLQRRAVDALPKQFQDAANTVDETPFPFHPIPTDTPPIKDYVHPQHAVF